MSSSGMSLAERLGTSAPGGRAARTKNGGAALRHKPYSASPRSSSGKFSEREDSNRDLDAPWTHDKFAKHNGIEGGELGARISGGTGRQITSGSTGEHPKSSRLVNNAFAALTGKKDTKKRAENQEGPLSIKGASSINSTGVEVDGLAPGTTAEDVAEIFSRCGRILEHRLASAPNASSVRVFLHFETAQAAQAAVSQFDKQTADGRTLNVFVVSAGPLGSKLGVAGRKNPPKGNVDLLATASSTGGMRSDELIANDPRAKVIVAPSGTNELLRPAHTPASNAPKRGGRGGGRGRDGPRGRGNPMRSLSERMDLD